MAIIVHSNSGMADRFYTLGQFQEFKENTGIDYVFLFNIDGENCENFQEYFHIDDELKVDVRNAGNDQFADVIRSKRFQEYQISDILTLTVNRDLPNDISNLDYLKTHNIYIECWNCIDNLPRTENWTPTDILKNHISPSDKIKEKLDTYLSQVEWLDDVPIGMHIRRTDYRECIEYSPDHLFYSKIDELIEKDPSVRIFLCTDDPILKQTILERYGQNHILTRKVKPRGSIGGFEDAVIDMFLLSKCRELFGTFHSGFVRLASIIGHVNLKTLHL